MREKRSWSERDGGRKEENREMETLFNACLIAQSRQFIEMRIDHLLLD